MALRYRLLVRALTLSFLLGSLNRCTAHGPEARGGSQAPEFERVERRKDLDLVLVFLPETARVRPAWESLQGELADRFDVASVEITDRTTPEDMALAIREYTPKCVVLFDNTTTALYARYQQRDATAKHPPAVILLTSFVDMYSEVKDAVSIAYEVPVVISASTLRTYIARPIERVGVVHRQAFTRHVRTQAKLARVEKLDLIARPVPDDATPRELASALEALLGADHVDAIWILNDNALLTPDHIAIGWLPLFAKDPIPTIVGIPGLVTRDAPFGTFAVVPDLGALGVQAANLIYALADRKYELERQRSVEQPLSVETVLDIDRARLEFGFREETRGELGAVAR
jgi:hypothetical protein